MLGLLNFAIPPWLKTAFLVATYVLAMAAAAHVTHTYHKAQAQKLVIAEQKETIKTEQGQAAVTVAVGVKAEKRRKKTAEVFDERAKEIAKHEETTTAAPGAEPLGSGLLPTRTVCLWDSANEGVLPPAGCLADASASQVTVRDLEQQKEREAKGAHDNEQQVDILQEWICKQALLHNGVLPPFPVCTGVKEPP